MNTVELEYVGFWPRVSASIIDTLLQMMIVAPLLTWIYCPTYWLSDELFHGIADILLN